MFLNRSRPRGPDRLLEIRMTLFALGAFLGLVGIMRNGEGWWVPAGILFLGAGTVLSLVHSVRSRREEDGVGESEP